MHFKNKRYWSFYFIGKGSCKKLFEIGYILGNVRVALINLFAIVQHLHGFLLKVGNAGWL